MTRVEGEATVSLNGTATLPIAELEFLRKIERENTLLVKRIGYTMSGHSEWMYYGKDEFIKEAAADAERAETFLETYRTLYNNLTQEKARLIDTSLGARLRFLFTGKR